MPTRLAGFVYSLATGLIAAGETVTPRASDGTAGATAVTNAVGFVAMAGLADKTWFGTVADSGKVFVPALETFVQDDIHNQSNTLSAHDVTQIRGLASWLAANLFSIHTYVFVPDAAQGAAVVAGNQQGAIHHSGPVAETALKLSVDAETAPGASGLPITIEYGDTDDLDTVGSWTEIATYTLSSEQSNFTGAMTNESIPANRLLRMNVGTIVGSPADVTVSLRVKRPVSP